MEETINNLMQANIRVWMITGDKKETAINIGHTTNLVGKGYKMIDFACSQSPRDIKEAIESLTEVHF